jgi:hypothetical protein
MKKNLILTLLLLTGFALHAQQKPDTVIVELAKSSRVIFTIKDRNDLSVLRQYDFQALFTDILNKIDNTPVKTIATDSTVQLQEKETESEEIIWEDNDEDDDEWYSNHGRQHSRKTHHSINFDLGVNNYLSDGKFPDESDELYTVRPWGSWYVGINSIQHTPISGKLYLEWGLGISWYNFKFEQDNVLISKSEDGLVFTEDTRDVQFIKSKLTASYINASLVPVFDFGGRGIKTRVWDSYGSKFRIGLGPYAGYRIGSHSKLVYDDGDKEKDKDFNNFYLNNFRYGLRLQLGIYSTDLFINYDLNELFSTSKPNNPSLNAFSFGIVF